MKGGGGAGAGVGCGPGRQYAHGGGFSGAVATHQANAVTGLDSELLFRGG